MATSEVQHTKSVDGNTAATHVAYAFSDISFLFPITPATNMGELADLWAETGRKNIWGMKVEVCPMQSEGGVAGAIHGAAVSGAIVSTFTSSHGLMLMIPDMFRLAGELQPCVIHVASRAVGSQSLTIYADHNDVMATRVTGFAYLHSTTVQEVADMALVAHLATLEASVPFLHWFDGFRTSHEISKVQLPEYSAIARLVNRDAVQRLRDRSLNPLHPHLLGTVEGSDVFFQLEERSNPYFNEVPAIVDRVMRRVEAAFGRSYHLFDYYGAPDAESVVVLMGAGVPVAEEAIDYLIAREGRKWGVVKPRLFQPWSAEHFIAAVPKTCKRIAVLDKTKEPGALGEPLWFNVVASFSGRPGQQPLIVGGRYGLGGKEFTPGCVRAVFQNLESPSPKNHFTVNIIDDLTHTNIPMAPEIPTVPEGTRQCMFWGLGADGTVGANHDAIKIVGDNTDLFVQGYFAYDAHKSGGLTVSHLRFGKQPIKSEYLILDADYSACHFATYVRMYDMVALVKEAGTFVLNCPWTDAELDKRLPAKMKRDLCKKKVSLYAIDASTLAESIGLGRRVNTVMQAVFFKLSGVLPVEQAIALLKDAVTKTYKIKGSKVVDMNICAIDTAVKQVRQVPVPPSWADAVDEPVRSDAPKPPEFIEDVVRRSFKLEGDQIPVSKFPPGGVNPFDMTRYEKRGMALQLPQWNPAKCTTCTECSLMCPHATIRPFVLTAEEAAGMETCEGKGKLAPNRFRIQVSARDCTGCGVCAHACRFGALHMVPATPELMEREDANWRRVEPRPGKPPRGAGLLPRMTATGSQYYQPLLEFSGCCFTAESTRVLTNRGFLYLEQIEQLISSAASRPDSPLKFAAYDTATKSIVYADGKLFYPGADGQHPHGKVVEQDFVEFTDTAGRARGWAVGSSPYMDQGTPSDNADQSNYVSLLVTPEHDMYVQLARRRTDETRRLHYRTPAGLVCEEANLAAPSAKFHAESLLPTSAVDEWCNVFRFTAVAESGYAGDKDALDEALLQAGLRFATPAARDAFIEIYFFWVGDGSTEGSSSGSGQQNCATFRRHKKEDVAWLRQKFGQLGLVQGSDWASTKEDLGVKLTIKEHSLAAFLAEAHSAKYRALDDYDGKGKFLKSVKLLMPWVWHLGKDLLVPAIEALRRADGTRKGDEHSIYTSSHVLRDQLLDLMVRAGYTVRFDRYRKKGDLVSTTGDTACHAHADGWKVYYSNHAQVARPDLERSDEVTRVTRVSRAWCVTVEHPNHLIFAQRAEHDDQWVTTKASRPIIVGNCEGCGETPYIKLLTQLFGERMVITNAAGCSSVWGGTWGMIPYTTNSDGLGPAWGNSLFEDNAEYGFGMAKAHLQRRLYLHDLIVAAAADGSGISDDLRKLFKQWLTAYDKSEDPQAIVAPLIKAIDEERRRDPALTAKLAEIKNNADQLPKISYWLVGGDGWAYDIDFGGLDHVVAMGAPNVRVVVLDTEIYSNTGGQRSKATNMGAIAKFAAGGNRKLKKDLGMMFMSYGDIYVASVSLHANPAQCLRAITEAESYQGTSVILCYAPCKEHGFPMDHIVEESKAAIDSGYWPLYRYDPRKNPALQLDSKPAKMSIRDFVMRENRYAALSRQDSEVADKLFATLAESKAQSFDRLKFMAESHAKAATALAAAEKPAGAPAATPAAPKPAEKPEEKK